VAKAYRHQDGYAADDAQTRALAFFQSTFGAVILHSVNVPFQRVQAEGDDEHAEALRQKAAAQTGRRICWSWRGAIAPPANAERLVLCMPTLSTDAGVARVQ
jgi:hypothetical protein